MVSFYRMGSFWGLVGERCWGNGLNILGLGFMLLESREVP